MISRKLIFSPLLTAILLCVSTISISSNQIDSLLNLASKTDNQASLISYYNQVGNALRKTYPDSAMIFYKASLKLASKNHSNKNYAETISGIGVVWAIKNNYDSAIFFTNKSIELARQNNNIELITKGLNSLGLIEIRRMNYKKAIPLLKKAYDYTSTNNDIKLKSKINNNLGLAYNRIHKYDSSLIYYLASLKIKEKTSDQKGIGSTTSNIALVYEKLGDFDLSISYLEQSLNIRQRNKNEYGEAIVYNNLGLVYESKEEYTKAMEYYLKSLILMQKLQKKARMATCYNNIGSILAKQKDFRHAIKYLNKALEINIELNNIQGQAYTYLDLGNFYRQIRNYYKAIKYYKQCFSIAKKFDDIDIKTQCYQGLYYSYEQLGATDIAFHYFKTMVYLKDSISIEKSKKRVELLEIEYQILKRKKENEALLKENQSNKAKIKHTFFTATLLAILLVFFILISVGTIYNRNKIKKAAELISLQKNEIQQQTKELKKANAKMKELSQFKEEMSGMIVHDLKNPINTIINIADSDNNENGLLIKHSGKKMLNLVMNILDVQKYENAGFELVKQFAELRYIIYKAIAEVKYNAQLKNIEFILPKKTDYVLNVDVGVFERILVNLLSNALKFSPDNSKIKIEYETLGNNKVKIHIIDKGPGIKNELLPSIFDKFNQVEKRNIGFSGSTGIGLTFCKIAIESHEGNIGVSSKQGVGSDFWLLVDYSKKIALGKAKYKDEKTKDFDDLYLSYDTKELLTPYIERISDYLVYQISDIRKIISKLNKIDNKSIRKYSKELNDTVLACNETRYKYLIKLVLDQA